MISMIGKSLSRLSNLMILIAILVSGMHLHAQIPDIGFYQMNDPDQLADVNYNSFLLKDSRGFVWISSEKGINRFDGRFVKQYRSGSENEFFESSVSEFFEDQNGDLWFAGYRGINHYIRKTDEIQAFQVTFPDDTVSVDKNYDLIHLEKRNHRLWMLVLGQIVSYDIQSGEYYFTGQFTEGVNFSVDTFEDGRLKEILSCLWLRGKGIEFFSKERDQNWQKQSFFKSGTGSPEYNGLGISSAEKLKGTYWLFSNKGIIQFDPEYPEKSKLYQPDGESQFHSLYGAVYNDSTLLVSTAHKRIMSFETGSKQFETIWKSNEKGAQPGELMVGPHQGIWVSKHGYGVDYSFPEFNSFQNPAAHFFLAPPQIRIIRKDSSGNKWLVSLNKGIHVIRHPDSLNWHFSYQDPKPGGLYLQRVRDLEVDPKGMVYCLGPNSILQFDPARQMWKEVFHKADYTFFFMGILPAGRILISSDHGMMELDCSDSCKLMPVSALSDYASFDIVRFFVSRKGYALFQRANHEILVYRIASGDRLEFLQTIPITNEVISYSDGLSKHQIWLATASGPMMLDIKQLTLQPVLDQKWRLEWGRLTGMKEIPGNFLLLTSSKGLWKHELGTASMVKFGVSDGLAGENFYEGANIVDQAGKIWLGHSKGLAVFHPDSLQTYPYPPTPYVDELLINNVEYEGEVSIGEESAIRLSYRENSLVFKLIAIGMYEAEKNQVKYRLKNLDRDWIYIKSGEYARFGNLSPGKYLLEFTATNVNQVESPLHQLSITIRPPFWQTWWFILLCMLAGAGIVRLYIEQKLAEERLIQEERNRISSDLHDNLAQDLSSILFISENLVDQSKMTGNGAHFHRIHTLIKHAKTQLKEIIWVTNSQNDNLDNLLFYIRKNASEVLGLYELEANLSFPDPIPQQSVRAEFRKSVSNIVKEALGNIVKHAEATKVDLTITHKDKKLFIYISDNGKGMDLSQDKYFGNGLRNMRQRAERLGGAYEIDSAPGKGTQIKVVLPTKKDNYSKMITKVIIRVIHFFNNLVSTKRKG